MLQVSAIRLVESRWRGYFSLPWLLEAFLLFAGT